MERRQADESCHHGRQVWRGRTIGEECAAAQGGNGVAMRFSAKTVSDSGGCRFVRQEPTFVIPARPARVVGVGVVLGVLARRFLLPSIS